MKSALKLTVVFLLLAGLFSCIPASERVRFDIDLPFKMPEFSYPVIPSAEFFVSDYLMDTASNNIAIAIEKAISSATKLGGGKVIVPSGRWISGPITLEDNIELHFDDECFISFSDNLYEYLPAVKARHQGIDCYKFKPLVHAEGCKNVVISGKGTLFGNGKAWWKYNDRRKAAWQKLEAMAEAGLAVEKRIFNDTLDNYLPPSFIQFVDCENILIEDIKVMYGPFWTINPLYSGNIIIRNVSVETEGDYGHTQNGDGINLSSCKNVLIENCEVSTGDDCFTLKSGRGKDGILAARPTENVIIRNCIANKGHGGVVIGSETSGGIYNVFVKDCQFFGTDRGIRIKTARGRGASVENIWFENITMDSILNEAIVLNMLRYTPRLPAFPVDSTTPYFRNINISDVRCDFCAGTGIKIVGLPEGPMSGVQISNVFVNAVFGMTATDVNGLNLSNLQVSSENSPAIELIDCAETRFDHLNVIDGELPFVKVIGPNSANLSFRDSSFDDLDNWLVIEKGVDKSQIKIFENE